MLYFAYGSNLDCAQMKDRCPSVHFVARAVLKGYRFGFTRFARTRQCGVMDIVKDNHSEVWGIIYEINENDVESLDSSEGYVPGRQKNAYRRIQCLVYKEGDEAQHVEVSTYEVVNKAENMVLPNQEYKRLATIKE